MSTPQPEMQPLHVKASLASVINAMLRTLIDAMKTRKIDDEHNAMGTAACELEGYDVEVKITVKRKLS